MKIAPIARGPGTQRRGVGAETDLEQPPPAWSRRATRARTRSRTGDRGPGTAGADRGPRRTVGSGAGTGRKPRPVPWLTAPRPPPAAPAARRARRSRRPPGNRLRGADRVQIPPRAVVHVHLAQIRRGARHQQPAHTGGAGVGGDARQGVVGQHPEARTEVVGVHSACREDAPVRMPSAARADSQNKRPIESVDEVLVGGSIRPRGRAPIKEGMAWNEADSRRE